MQYTELIWDILHNICDPQVIKKSFKRESFIRGGDDFYIIRTRHYFLFFDVNFNFWWLFYLESIDKPTSKGTNNLHHYL